jgi:hypothetical protein
MTFGKRIFLPLCLAGVLAGAPAAFAQDTADESRAIERQVGELFKAAKFAEA